LPTVEQNDSLRHALSLILKTGAPQLTVVENGVAVGMLTLEHIRKAARISV